MTIFGVIPARSGSKGLKNKNLRKISNKTLLEISIKKLKLLQKAKFIEDFIVSTDSEVYSKIAKRSGSKVQMRPKYLSNDKIKIVEVLNQLKKKYKYNYYLTLVPTAPLITIDSIKKLILSFKRKKNISIGTLSKIESIHPYLAMKKNNYKYSYILKGNFLRYPRQIRPNLYHFNGCVFIRHNNFFC